MLHPENRVPLNPKGFEALVHVLRENVDLLAPGKRLVPWKTPSKAAIARVIRSGGTCLPLIYQDKYVHPVVQNLDSIIQRANTKTFSSLSIQQVREKYQRTMEVLAGAVYCHIVGPKVSEDTVKAIRCFLAVVSNTHQSFLPANPRPRADFPDFKTRHLPPLATFRNGEVAPSILTSNEIEKLSGGTVGVVVLPASYMAHPLLWTAIAHEVGGHEMLAAFPGLLAELQKGVRQLFNVGSVQGPDKLRDDQIIGLVWQYWTEETVSDVCGVLNIGPSYGISLAVYQAALNIAFAKKYGQPDKTLLRLWSGVNPKYAPRIDTNDLIPDLDLHPTDILKLHVIIGAIESLPWLLKAHREEYVSYLEKLANKCANGEKEIHLCGSIQAGRDVWLRINTYKTGALDLGKLQDAARRVGAYIASVELNALGGKSLQTIETWGERDEDIAQDIARTLIASPETDVSGKGEDAHLLAGSTLAFTANPNGYEVLAESLMNALEISFARDQYWGHSALHYLVEYHHPSSEKDMEALACLLDTPFLENANSRVPAAEQPKPTKPKNRKVVPVKPQEPGKVLFPRHRAIVGDRRRRRKGALGGLVES